MKKGAVLLLTLSLFGGIIYADQTGDCTAGSQYCEQNSIQIRAPIQTVTPT